MIYDNFKLFTELDIVKAESKGSKQEDSDRYKNMIFSGVASDRSKDAEEESLDPNGFIYDRFLKSGLFNLDHLPSRSPVNKSKYWIGEPIEAHVKDGKFFVKGKLWEKSPEARAFWDKALEMKESGSTRKPGMSVEGKALERDPKNPAKITKALITNVALTFTPVNDHTYLDIQKSRVFDPNDLQASSILLEYEFENQKICINKNLECSIIEKSRFDVDNFWTIYKSYQKGLISKQVLDDYVKKIENNFEPIK
jgi:hypothetical protein